MQNGLRTAQKALNKDNVGKEQKRTVGFVILEWGEQPHIREAAGREIRRVVQAAGLETDKIAHIHIRSGKEQEQVRAVRHLNNLVGKIRAEEKEEMNVRMWSSIATGYANAAYHFDLITKKELDEIFDVIWQATEKAAWRIYDRRHPVLRWIAGRG